MSGPDPGGDLPAYAELVLDAVETIPEGRVLAYGDVAELVGEGGPRQVGTVMSRYGGGVPWWRVIRADGSVLDQLADEAVARWREEGTPLRPDGRRVDMRRGRWEGPVG